MRGRTLRALLALAIAIICWTGTGGLVLAQTAGGAGTVDRFKPPVTDRLPRLPADESPVMPSLPPPEAGGREGYSIAAGPLSRAEHNADGGFIVAGCVPQTHSRRAFPVGSSWSLCNDLDFVKDKVEETEVTSCLDIYEHGVVEGFFIKEVNNRTWESFRISCKNLKKDGTLGAKQVKAPFLFNFEKDGTLYSTVIPKDRLAFGIFELENALQLKESLLSVGLLYQSAEEIHAAAAAGRPIDDVFVTDRAPPAKPLTVDIDN